FLLIIFNFSYRFLIGNLYGLLWNFQWFIRYRIQQINLFYFFGSQLISKSFNPFYRNKIFNIDYFPWLWIFTPYFGENKLYPWYIIGRNQLQKRFGVITYKF